jgi:hypothetical protein
MSEKEKTPDTLNVKLAIIVFIFLLFLGIFVFVFEMQLHKTNVRVRELKSEVIQRPSWKDLETDIARRKLDC